MSAHQALRRLFGEVTPAPTRERRLDVAALKAAAHAAGFADECEAIRAAIDTRIAGHAAINSVLSGVRPGAITRWQIASLLQVSERVLWPVDEREVH
jgi:hypothetical protein